MLFRLHAAAPSLDLPPTERLCAVAAVPLAQKRVKLRRIFWHPARQTPLKTKPAVAREARTGLFWVPKRIGRQGEDR